MAGEKTVSRPVRSPWTNRVSPSTRRAVDVFCVAIDVLRIFRVFVTFVRRGIPQCWSLACLFPSSGCLGDCFHRSARWNDRPLYRGEVDRPMTTFPMHFNGGQQADADMAAENWKRIDEAWEVFLSPRIGAIRSLEVCSLTLSERVPPYSRHHKYSKKIECRHRGGENKNNSRLLLEL